MPRKIAKVLCVAAMLVAVALMVACDEQPAANIYTYTKVIEEVTDTVIRDISNEGKPWMIIDSLINVVEELKLEADSLQHQLDICYRRPPFLNGDY